MKLKSILNIRAACVARMMGFHNGKTLNMETQKGFDPKNYYLKMGRREKILTAKLLLTAKQSLYLVHWKL